jgi:hypothetical protein
VTVAFAKQRRGGEFERLPGLQLAGPRFTLKP